MKITSIDYCNNALTRHNFRFFTYDFQELLIDYQQDVACLYTPTFRQINRELPIYTAPTYWKIFMKVEECKLIYLY